MKSLGSSFKDLLKTIKTIFNNITVSFSLTQGSPPPPDLDFGLCARVSQRFYSTLSPRSNFPTGQRFLLPNHVTSGCLSPRSLFPTAQRFLLPKHVTSGCLSPRSLFPTAQRFPLPNHVTSGCLSPRSLFPTAQRFPLPNHVTSGCLSPRSP